MATASTKAGLSITPSALSDRLMPVNTAPAGFDAARDLPAGFLEFLAPLHAALTLRQRSLIVRREAALQQAHAGKLPDFLPPSATTTQAWEIELPEWCWTWRIPTPTPGSISPPASTTFWKRSPAGSIISTRNGIAR